MSYKKVEIIKKIADNLAFSSKSTALENAIGLFDNNRGAQDFFAELFKLIFRYKDLKELDKLNDIVNYPAIDLGDEKVKIAFQITTKKDSEKVKDTIKKFIKYKLYEKYDRLVIFVIGEKQSSYIDFDTQLEFTFDKEKDIWDDNFLIKEINKLDIAKLKEIQKFLEENLIEFKLPENLFPDDIKKCIEILKRDFGNPTTLKMKLNIYRGDDNFIKDVKNPANNISWKFFKERIRGHLQHNQDILEFLSNPINKEIQRDYLKVSQEIQDFYKNSANNFSSFEEVFRQVFDKINILYDDNNLNKIKIMILLHNMYFNCDIGDNPNNND
ncbi:SMEK domain-containing protein [Candidatus Parcubacteria bacterium]|nr:SMEK domain-containing protein [Candidatus Parcubacteria bacterium]